MKIFFPFRSVSFLVLQCLIFFTSCQKIHMTKEELQEYVKNENHGLIKKEKSNNHEVVVMFRPSDLLIAQEAQLDTDSIMLEKLRRKYSNHYYFILSISDNNKEALTPKAMGNERFSEVLQTISFRMSDYLNLTTPQDTIPLADYSFSRTFGMAGSTDVLIAFEKRKVRDQPYLQINLKEFGMELGNQSLRFEVRDIEDIPQLIF